MNDQDTLDRIDAQRLKFMKESAREFAARLGFVYTIYVERGKPNSLMLSHGRADSNYIKIWSTENGKD